MSEEKDDGERVFHIRLNRMEREILFKTLEEFPEQAKSRTSAIRVLIRKFGIERGYI